MCARNTNRIYARERVCERIYESYVCVTRRHARRCSAHPCLHAASRPPFVNTNDGSQCDGCMDVYISFGRTLTNIAPGFFFFLQFLGGDWFSIGDADTVLPPSLGTAYE